MRRSSNQRQQLGDYWLWQRQDSGTWCICWLDRTPGRSDRTRRKATPVRSDVGSAAPQGALDALAAYYLEHGRPAARQPTAEALVDDLMADWLRYHVSTLAAPDRYMISVQHWTAFFDMERCAGRLTNAVTVRHLTPQLQARFRQWRAKAGVGGHTIARDLAAVRGALSWAWKNQRIEHPPFIADVPPHQKAPARDRVLSFTEVASLMNACHGRDDREHLLRFIIIELGIAGRPEAVLELTSDNLDFGRSLIDPNQAGRVHSRKRRPIVPIANAVRPWVTGITGKLIAYRVPIAKENRVPGGATHFMRPTLCIKTSWKGACKDAGILGATPKTLRHTMLTWLAERGVPKEQRMALAGHAAQDTTAKNYEHLSPSYLRVAIVEVDAYFTELAKHTTAHLRSANDTGAATTLAA